MDWYRAVRRVKPNREVIFITDLFGGEGYADLSRSGDRIFSLLIIDAFLFSGQSRYSNLWRNMVKLVLLPLQAIKLRRILTEFPNRVVHAHPMYYMALCLLAGVEYLGTPQGDEILIRPCRSKLYRYFAGKVLKSAKAVIVDSVQMKNGIKAISGAEAHVFQNGINVDEIAQHHHSEQRERVLSIRGLEPLYRIQEIVDARNKTLSALPLSFIYPFADAEYFNALRPSLLSQDEVLGRLGKSAMYRLLSESLLVISIPSSDSSPRSVYESIFAGACVAATYNPWMELLPTCMRARVVTVDLADAQWLAEAMDRARHIAQMPFVPSDEALELYDENRSIGKVIEKFY